MLGMDILFLAHPSLRDRNGGCKVGCYRHFYYVQKLQPLGGLPLPQGPAYERYFLYFLNTDVPDVAVEMNCEQANQSDHCYAIVT